jgi:hypothetical protein
LIVGSDRFGTTQRKVRIAMDHNTLLGKKTPATTPIAYREILIVW